LIEQVLARMKGGQIARFSFSQLKNMCAYYLLLTTSLDFKLFYISMIFNLNITRFVHS